MNLVVWLDAQGNGSSALTLDKVIYDLGLPFNTKAFAVIQNDDRFWPPTKFDDLASIQTTLSDLDSPIIQNENKFCTIFLLLVVFTQ